MKNIFFILLISINLFAANKTISIVNEGIKLPSLHVEDKSNLDDFKLKKSFNIMILNDLRVSSNFTMQGEKNADFSFDYALFKQGLGLRLDVILKEHDIKKGEYSISVNSVSKYPFLSHKAVVKAVQILGFPSISWMDKMLLIARTTSSRRSDILITDYTLTYKKIIIKGGLNLFPKWANPAQSAFYYTAYNKQIPTVFEYNLKTNDKKQIIASRGMMVVSAVGQGGKKLLLTMAPHDQPDIYLYNLDTKALTQVTNYSGIDVSGNFIDNDNKVVFVSDRLGYPNIFITDLKSKIAEQAVFHGKNNISVSSYKDYIVYSSREPGKHAEFNLYLMSTKSDYIRQLSANGKNLFPRFSADGESIVFIKHLGGQSALGIVRLNANKIFSYPLNVGKIQSIDW